MTTVLLCDDSPQLRELVRVVLELEGNEVVGEAADGREAVAAAKSLQPEVVLLDLSMPLMDGLEAIPEIRRVAPGAKIVVYSGFAHEDLVERAFGLGVERYVAKGGDPAEVAGAVADVARS